MTKYYCLLWKPRDEKKKDEKSITARWSQVTEHLINEVVLANFSLLTSYRQK